MSDQVPLDVVLDLIRDATDPQVLQQARERQKAVWEGVEPDYLPLVVDGAAPERSDYPSYNLEEQFHDPEKMLFEQLWGALRGLRGKADGMPSIRVNFGCGFVASVFGLKQEIFPDKMPWLQERLTKSEVLKLTPDSLEPITEKGLMPECRRYLELYQEKLEGTEIKIYLADTQGPFDTAHLVLGDSLLTELYDDPGFVRHLLTLTSYAYREVSRAIKNWIGEPDESGHHGRLYMSNCGVRCCEDTTTLLSPPLVEQTLPFLQDGVSPFGAWVHFCGGHEHLLKAYLSLPETRGLNFGNPELFEWGPTLSQIAEADKVYYGGVPRRDAEPLDEYFRRILSPLERKGHLIFSPALRGEETAPEALRVWHEVQDSIF